MIVYAVIRHSRYAYGTMTTNELEKVFETEKQAWEWIEYRYYNTINLNNVRSAILLNAPLRPEGGLNVYGETYVAEFQIHGETYSESFNICKVPMVLNTTVVFKPNKNLDEFVKFDKHAYEKLLYVLCLLYRTAKDDDEKEHLYRYMIEVYDIMHELEKKQEELHNTETIAKG